LATALLVVAVAACGGTTAADVRIKKADTFEALGEPPPSTKPVDVSVTEKVVSSNECVASLTVDQKVGQLIMVLTADPSKVTQFASEGKIGGVGLLADQDAGVAARIAQVKGAASIPLAIASDEEGGTVQRLKAVLGPLPSARDSRKTMSAAQVGDMWKRYAQGMAGLGLTMNFGPVLDVGYGIAIKSRAFSDQTAVVTEYGMAALEQTNAGGIIPVAKHWPGLGSGSADPHGKISLVGDKATLVAKDLPPFEAAIAKGVQAIMVTHVNIPDVTNGGPATLSPDAIRILREEEGFKGVIMTDSLGMGAVTNRYSQPEAAELAIIAGNDVVLTNGAESVLPVHARLVDAVNSGRISEQRIDQSLERWFRLKGVSGACAGGAAATTPAAGAGSASTLATPVTAATTVAATAPATVVARASDG
jgi:beta-N-acetylhexosaminidase